jgi:excisionase family DNA binding protein
VTDRLGDLKFWTVKEAATLMRVSKMSVYRLVNGGELESVRVGRCFRIPEDALARYLGQAQPPASQPSAAPGTTAGHQESDPG